MPVSPPRQQSDSDNNVSGNIDYSQPDFTVFAVGSSDIYCQSDSPAKRFHSESNSELITQSTDTCDSIDNCSLQELQFELDQFIDNSFNIDHTEQILASEFAESVIDSVLQPAIANIVQSDIVNKQHIEFCQQLPDITQRILMPDNEQSSQPDFIPGTIRNKPYNREHRQSVSDEPSSMGKQKNQSQMKFNRRNKNKSK